MRVIRSAGQNVSPSDDGRLFDQIFTDGLFEETTITHLGANNVALGAMYGIICGRDFTAEAQTVAVELPEDDAGTTGYIYVEIDTSSDDVITIGSALAPFTPTYEDLNTNGAVAQMIIAEYVASSVAITSLTPSYVMATSGSVLPGSVATVEVSPAVANHSVGDFILYGGQLYSVTAAISVGETLTPGTNISATSAGSELSSLKSGLTNVRTLNGMFGYKDRTVSNIAISSDNGYAILGNVYSDWQIPANAYVIGFYVRGWSSSPGTFSLASSSDGRSIYVISTKAGTIGTLSIRVWYALF